MRIELGHEPLWFIELPKISHQCVRPIRSVRTEIKKAVTTAVEVVIGFKALWYQYGAQRPSRRTLAA